MPIIEHGQSSGPGRSIESAAIDKLETAGTELILRRKNLEAKKRMAAELVSMGFGVDAIARILHLKQKNSSHGGKPCSG